MDSVIPVYYGCTLHVVLFQKNKYNPIADNYIYQFSNIEHDTK